MMDKNSALLIFLLLINLLLIKQGDALVRVALSKATTMEAGAVKQPVTSYYLNVDIGTPTKPFKMLLDINAKETWLPHYLKLGIIYNRLHYSSGYSKKDSSTSIKENKEFTIDYNGCQLTGKPYEDLLIFSNVTESSKKVLFTQRFLAISSASNGLLSEYPTDGVLSLNSAFMSDTGSRSFLINMNQHHLIDELKFALYLNSDLESNDGGELTLGGYNPLKFTGTIYHHSLVNMHDRWELALQHVMLGSQIVSCQQKKCSAVLSTGVNELLGPVEDVKKIMDMLLVTKQKKEADLYEIECLRVVDLPTIHFYIDGIVYSVPPSMYVKKKTDGLVFKSSTCYVTIFANKQSDQWILGTNFLANYYSIFDFNRRQVGFAKKQ